MSLLELARKPAAVVAPETTVLEAVGVMHRERVGAVAVVGGGVLVGIFSERDVMTRVVLAEKSPRSTLVRDVMTSDPASVTGAVAADDALRVMVERHFRHLPVVDAGRHVLGMLSMRHLMRHRIDILDKELEGVSNYAGADGIGG
jgi:CBS domain-containing protein